MKEEIIKLQMSDIIIDTTIQQRVKLNEATIRDYTMRLNAGDKFPPVVVFDDGSAKYLSDGFHRIKAYEKAGKTEIPTEVRKGGKRDATLYAVESNASHGLPRTNRDKRKAVTTLLDDFEWSKRSTRDIANKAIVSHTMVENILKKRKKDAGNGCQQKDDVSLEDLKKILEGNVEGLLDILRNSIMDSPNVIAVIDNVMSYCRALKKELKTTSK